uniref:Uncharacterized protein n=1 Tax=Rhizophora mucronata TaxID=61149 RepID=A0A2P2R3C9_RHIMU
MRMMLYAHHLHGQDALDILIPLFSVHLSIIGIRKYFLA